jgi:hypothetical protein
MRMLWEVVGQSCGLGQWQLLTSRGPSCIYIIYTLALATQSTDVSLERLLGEAHAAKILNVADQHGSRGAKPCPDVFGF